MTRSRVLSGSVTVAILAGAASNQPPPPIAFDKSPTAPLAAVPISPGQQEVAILVTVVYELQ